MAKAAKKDSKPRPTNKTKKKSTPIAGQGTVTIRPKKSRASKYEEKLSIKGTFKDVFKVVKKNKEEKAKQNGK